MQQSELELSLDLEFRALARTFVVLRNRAGLTQEDAIALARQNGVKVSLSALQGWEKGQHIPKWRGGWSFLRAIGYNIGEITDEWQEQVAILQADKTARSVGSDDLFEALKAKAQDSPEFRAELARLAESAAEPLRTRILEELDQSAPEREAAGT